MDKIKIGIIGTGNIGTDLLMKIMKSELLECTIFAGQNSASQNIKRASEMGINTSFNGINALLKNKNNIDIIIDATSAESHKTNASVLRAMGKHIINLTPVCDGVPCIPYINGEECADFQEINLITCAGQATIPLVYSIVQTGCKVSYIETVSTIASKSAGKATRENIDEFIETTSSAMSIFTEVKNTKVIMIINPNEPPINMRNTIYMKIEQGNIEKISNVVKQTEHCIRKYVSGYKIIVNPIFIDNILTITLQVSGKGDFLPKYAGNLDIITCAAIEMAEKYCRSILMRREQCKENH